MDYEEFLWAQEKDTYDTLEQFEQLNKPIGNEVNRRLMRDFRVYMAVGGMPQAVEAFIDGKNFAEIDFVKREIIKLYKDDFKKIDPRGRVSAIYDAVPAQLAAKKHYFVMSSATGKRKSKEDVELLYNLVDSKTVMICNNVTNPTITLVQTRGLTHYKLYLSDIGLFTSMLFNDGSEAYSTIYSKLLSDKIDANLGYLYENAIAQIIKTSGRELYYHTWKPHGKSHAYEIDFLIPSKMKLVPIEVKSSNINNHKSIEVFSKKYSNIVSRRIMFSQKDVGKKEMLELKPIYLAPIIISKL